MRRMACQSMGASWQSGKFMMADTIKHGSVIRTGALCLFLLLSFSSIKYLPGMLIVQDVFTALIFLFWVLICLYQALAMRISAGRLELYGLLILISVPIVSAYTTYIEFGQPYWYGFLAQRELVLIGCSVIFLHLYRRRVLSLEDVERALLWLAWLSLIGNTLANLFIDASQLGDQAGFSSAGLDGESGQLKLEKAFIIFGFFYYAFVNFGSRGEKKHHIYFSLLFLAYLVFVSSGRSDLVAMLVSYLFFSIKWRTPQAITVFLFKITAAIILMGVFFYIFPSASLLRLEEKFGDAIQAAVTGQEGNDVSANARILEVGMAAPYIEKNWFLGNGFISNQWQGGFAGVIGYFHPSDIGLLGVVYEYGVLGLMIFSVQLYFIWKYAQQLPVMVGQYHRFTNAIKGFLLYFVLNSITTGRYVFLVEQSFFCIVLLYCATQIPRQYLITKDRP